MERRGKGGEEEKEMGDEEIGGGGHGEDREGGEEGARGRVQSYAVTGS